MANEDDDDSADPGACEGCGSLNGCQGECAETTKEMDRDWEHIWRPLVIRADGSVDIDQLKREFADFSFLLSQVPSVYAHVTGGILSKPNYHAATIIAIHDDKVTEHVENALLEAREALWDGHECPFYPAGAKKDGDVWSCEACGIDFKTDDFEDISWASGRKQVDRLKAALEVQHTFDNPYEDGMCWCPKVAVDKPHDKDCRSAREAMGIECSSKKI